MSKALLLLLVPLIAIAVLQVTIPDNDEGLPNWVVFHGALRAVHLLDKMKNALMPASQRVFALTTTYWRSDILRTITSLRVADAFRTAKKQSMTCSEIIDQLARLSPPVDSVHAPFFCRVLHASTNEGLFEIDSKPISLAHILGTEKNAPPTPKFKITETGTLLDSQNPRGSYNLVMALTGNSRAAWNHLENAVHSGKSGFMEAYGQEIWDYHLEHDPEGLKEFNEAMRELSLVISVAARASYNFSSCSHICDIGGGVGTVGVQLIKNNPDSKATIFDLPFAEEEAHKFLKDQRVENRVNFVGGSFFNPEEIPKDCDCYVLKHILHDWDDESSKKILASVASALSPDDRVLLVEAVVGGTEIPFLEAQKLYMDLNMLASCPSGAKERSAHEYEQLLSAVGLSTTSITNTKSFVSIVEARLKK